MYTTRLAVIGGDGGGPFDHREHLQQQGYSMGCGENGMRLTKLHAEENMALSHVSATYSSCGDATVTCDVPGHGRLRGQSKGRSWDIQIGPNERVTMVAGEYGSTRYPWAYGDFCLHALTLRTESVEGVVRYASAGRKDFDVEHYHEPGAIQNGSHYLKAVRIPAGLTLAGIAGRTGDIWDEVMLFVSPYLPGQGVWDRDLHKHYCQPFKQQVQTLLLCLNRLSTPPDADSDQTQATPAIPWLPPRVREQLISALFKVTFMSPSSDDTGTDSADTDYISYWVHAQADEWGEQAKKFLGELDLYGGSADETSSEDNATDSSGAEDTDSIGAEDADAIDYWESAVWKSKGGGLG